MIAYKAFDKNLKCRDFQFEVGKTYIHEGEIKLCSSGFHACVKLSDCFNYYPFDINTRIAKVNVSGKIIHEEDGSKLVTNKIKIIKELTWDEVLKLANSGERNSGERNSGNRNSGDWNSGDWNSGDRNSGDRNSGHWNSGHWNSGNRNSGGWNSGRWNSGDWNSGDWNSGGRNSGDWNSGDRNSGDRNSGHWNSGDQNSGIFNTNYPDKVRVFNKFIKKEKYDSIKLPSFLYFNLTMWVSHDTATQEEKEKYKKEIETCGGYLKTIPYKEAFKLSWNKADKKDRMLIKKVPGFNKELFFEISGINVDED